MLQSLTHWAFNLSFGGFLTNLKSRSFFYTKCFLLTLTYDIIMFIEAGLENCMLYFVSHEIFNEALFEY